MAPADEATQIPPADALAPQPSTESDGSAPPEKDWKAEYARLRKDYDAKASRLNEIEKAVVPEPEPVKAPIEDETDFKIENAGRIKLVKDDYKKHLADLQADGAKLTPKLMAKALLLAEAEKGITSNSEAQRQAASASAPSVVNRETTSLDDVQITETDKAFNVSPEIKQKWKHLVEGQG